MQKVLAATSLIGVLCACTALCHSGEAASVGELPRPAHERPFFMPPRERARLRTQIRTQPWAKAERERIRAMAAKGDGFWAGFLYALEGGPTHLPAARAYLMKHGRARAPRYRLLCSSSPAANCTWRSSSVPGVRDLPGCRA